MEKVSGSLRKLLEPACFLHKNIKGKKPMEVGVYGMSYCGDYGQEQRKVAIKQLFTQLIDPHKMENICFEMAMLENITGQFIQPPIGFVLSSPLSVASEFAYKGSVKSALYSKDVQYRLNATQKTIIATGVAYGMRRLHKKGIVHGDLKVSNVLIGNDGNPLISDFGLLQIAQKYQIELKTKNVQMYWQAPEVAHSSVTTQSSDVFSYGVFLLEMLTENKPTIASNNYELPNSTPKMLAAVIKSCLHQDPSQRPTFKQIYRAFKCNNAFYAGAVQQDICSLVKNIKDKHHTWTARPLSKLPLPERAVFAEYFANRDLVEQTSPTPKRVRYMRLPKRNTITKPRKIKRTIIISSEKCSPRDHNLATSKEDEKIYYYRSSITLIPKRDFSLARQAPDLFLSAGMIPANFSPIEKTRAQKMWGLSCVATNIGLTGKMNLCMNARHES